MPTSYLNVISKVKPILFPFYYMVGFCALAFILVACSNEAEDTAEQKETAIEHARKHLDTRYVCPMHPRIIKDRLLKI